VALDANLESLSNLKANFVELGIAAEQVPIVFQYNKRDIRNILSVEELNRVLNPGGVPHFEAAALHGIGVFETLKAISRYAISFIRKKLADESPKKTPTPAPVGPPGTGPVATPAAAPVPAPAARPAAATSAKPAPAATRAPAAAESANPLAALVPDVPPAEELPVEFAAEDTDKHVVPVKTKGHVDIQQELEKLRAVTGAGTKAAGGASKDLERRLQDILVPEPNARQEVRRKASLEVPGRLLKGSSAMKIHLGFDGDGEEWVREAVTVKLVGNRRLERLTLHIELDIKGKS
jgi:hypothetical protein